MSAKYIVTLTADERIELTKLVQTGSAAGRVRTRAQILLKADVAPEAPGWTDEQIKDAFAVSTQTVIRGYEAMNQLRKGQAAGTSKGDSVSLRGDSRFRALIFPKLPRDQSALISCNTTNLST